MPISSSSNALLFDGNRVHTFLDVIRYYGDATGLIKNKKVDQIYYYSSKTVQDTIQCIPELDVDEGDKKWEVAMKKMVSLYANTNGYTSQLPVILKFETYSAVLVKKKIITTAESNYYFIAGLPEDTKCWLEMQIPADRKVQDKVMTYLYQ
ncbi:hypothetical protein Moror_11252 [Moniliophthora roreri MCA 2997]|uniref:Uncharacterized protein n=1 Tax=Moniliophthora roreri (strain MCA 2997) TaxID=1381753 RepID=V2XPM7_MONRO|nr:hypothetical protein Moror_11252 [Moniliophthora roreri MCA 2997]